MRVFVRLVIFGLAAALFYAAAGSMAVTAGPEPAIRLSVEEEEALALLNADRRAAGLSDLKFNATLVVVARDFADDMIARGFIGHYNPEGESPFDRMRRYGVTYRSAAENLAAHRSVAEAQRLLMDSEDHRKNILNADFNEVGIGVRPGPQGMVYLVQEFIQR